MAQQADLPAGVWRGVLTHGEYRGTLVVDFRALADGRHTATLSLPDIGADDAVELPVEPLDGGGLRVADWELRLTREGTLRGVLPPWLSPTHEIGVELSRSGSEPADPTHPMALAELRGTLPPLWTAVVGSGVWGGLALADGRLVLGTDEGRLHAIDPASGGVLWSTPLGGALRGEPTAEERDVWVRADDGYLYRVAADHGSIVDRARVSEPSDRPSLVARSIHRAGGVAVTDDAVFVGTDDGAVVALDRGSLDERWRAPTGGPVTGRPLVVGGTVYVGSHDGLVYALDATDGSVRWTHDTGAAVASTLAFDGRSLWVASRSWELIELAPETGTREWSRFFWFAWVESEPVVADALVLAGTSDGRDVTAFDRSRHEVRWRFEGDGAVWSAPAVGGGLVVVPTVGVRDYFMPHRGALHVVDAANGRSLFRFSAPDEGDGGYWGFAASPLVRDGLAFAADLTGRVYAFRLPAGP